MKNIFLTVDTECHDINNQDRYLWGRTRDGNQYGLVKYLELGKELNIPINFFVDVAECKRYGVDFVKNIVDLIRSYGQPVYFHLHPNYITGDDNRSYLWQYSYSEKKAILEEAYSYYKEVTGLDHCIAFRAGRYGSDSELYELLSLIMGDGVIDLSYGYGNGKMCHLSYEEAKTINGIKSYKGCWLFPNTSYVALKLFRKFFLFLDTSQTTFGEFRRFLRKNECNHIILTSHSWNFIRTYFFRKGYIGGNNREIKKFTRMVKYAEENGYQFADLRNLSLNESNYNGDDFCDLCSNSYERCLSIWANFVRFQKIACLTPKYLMIYAVFYLFLVLFSVSLFLMLL